MSDPLATVKVTARRLESLPRDSKGAAVAILKTCTKLDVNTRMMLSPGLVSGIIGAEAKRIGWKEWLGEKALGVGELVQIDLRKPTGGQGPGQLYPLAYRDVEERLGPHLYEFRVHMGVNCGLRWHILYGGLPLITKGYPLDVIDSITADFFIAAYLALRVMEAKKPGRSAVDQLQYGIGFYFGAREKTFPNAQAAISPQDSGKSVIAYQPVKDYLQGSDKAHDRDVAAYVQEVFDRR
ncbi:MAG TPA: hypothetical protein VJ890_28085 [Vineibacter sp.]|nr:hypothetical protein [Vineibacter sp.]